MAKEFPLVPQKVADVSTKYRKISGQLPTPETIKQLEALRKVEPQSMSGQAPIIWAKSDNFSVSDAYGNTWLDFSSGVLITNAGHGRKKIVDAICAQAANVLTTYCFPNSPRIALTQKLVAAAPEGLDKVFLLSTGAESTECALKLMRTHGLGISASKSVIVSYEGAFHGRTLGAQMMGGMPAGKKWVKNLDPEMVQVPFPDGYRNEDVSFELFTKTLAEKGVKPENVAGVIAETYQGIGPNFMPAAYAQALRKWCDDCGALLCFDEVQAGFGRCGTMWGFQNYDVTPDLFCMGKGISSSLPISGVIGRAAVMDQYGPNAMTSTHTGNPVCCAAALANLEIIQDEKLVDNAAKVGAVMQAELAKIAAKHDCVGHLHGKGLVAGLLIDKPGKVPNPDLAWDIINTCFGKGLLMFAPVGLYGECVKIAPPLTITEEAVLEGCAVIDEAITECTK